MSKNQNQDQQNKDNMKQDASKANSNKSSEQKGRSEKRGGKSGAVLSDVNDDTKNTNKGTSRKMK